MRPPPWLPSQTRWWPAGGTPPWVYRFWPAGEKPPEGEGGPALAGALLAFPPGCRPVGRRASLTQRFYQLNWSNSLWAQLFGQLNRNGSLQTLRNRQLNLNNQHTPRYHQLNSGRPCATDSRT